MRKAGNSIARSPPPRTPPAETASSALQSALLSPSQKNTAPMKPAAIPRRTPALLAPTAQPLHGSAPQMPALRRLPRAAASWFVRSLTRRNQRHVINPCGALDIGPRLVAHHA